MQTKGWTSQETGPSPALVLLIFDQRADYGLQRRSDRMLIMLPWQAQRL